VLWKLAVGVNTLRVANDLVGAAFTALELPLLTTERLPQPLIGFCNEFATWV
jgi:hypothetical protein